MQRHRRTSEEKKGGTVHGRVDKTLKLVQKSVKKWYHVRVTGL